LEALSFSPLVTGDGTIMPQPFLNVHLESMAALGVTIQAVLVATWVIMGLYAGYAMMGGTLPPPMLSVCPALQIQKESLLP